MVSREAIFAYGVANCLHMRLCTMNTKLPTRPRMDERIALVLPA